MTIEQADRDYDETGFIDRGGPLARLMRIELRTGRSQLYQWARRFEAPVLAGQMTMEESVEFERIRLDDFMSTHADPNSPSPSTS